jgi:preprotein translocase subunit SecG
MLILLTILHLFVCFFLILVVLLQTGKGADVAAAFGGTSQTAFGARGASTLLSKLTTISAIVFMVTTFTLALMTGRGSRSVVPDVPAGQTAPVEQPPAGTAPPANPAPADQQQQQTPPPAPQ